jgi:polyhydroxyalkanoate synthesis regulator phasin
MDPIQQLMSLAGYPTVGSRSQQAVQIAQAIQEGQISKQEAAELLEDLKTQNQIEAQANTLQEHVAFDQALSGLITIVSGMA